MTSVGYSDTPLIKKLGIKENMKVLLLHAPPDYLIMLERDISAQFCKKKQPPDFIQLFAADKKIFEREMKRLQPAWTTHTSVVIWISWYKKSTPMFRDLTEDIIRKYALAHGLVDVKVCAISEHWSGLKLVVPLSERRK